MDRSFDSDESDEYNYNDPDYDLDNERLGSDKPNPEIFQYKEVELNEVEGYLNMSVDALCKLVDIPPSIARLLLRTHEWNVENVKKKFLSYPVVTLINQNILPGLNSSPSCSDSRAVMTTIRTAQRLGAHVAPFLSPAKINSDSSCEICFCTPSDTSSDKKTIETNCSSSISNVVSNLWDSSEEQSNEIVGLCGLSCGHRFCPDCWRGYFAVKVEEGLSIEINCMSAGCNVAVVEDFLLSLLQSSEVKDKYLELTFHRLVESHPSLRFCTGLGCSVLIYALEEPKARRVQCSRCRTEFCFACSEAYHAPTSCATLKHWLVKCRDDSGTANYIAAHTRDCPSCHVCIEKNGGCNHMRCSMCHYEFCWVCLRDWNTHRVEYYFCSRYQENPDSAEESARVRARESLERYVFYYERWENHERSLKLEQEQRSRIQNRIHEKVMEKQGTWIDWQYLLIAADTLRKCRYTLKYTYPHAFYGDKLERKELFEYQQALLEAEVENLSWKIEHAEITDRADLLNKMDICEKHRLTLLQEFLTD